MMTTYRSNKNKGERTGVCEVCGRYGLTHLHHVFEGAGRRRIDINPIIEVCPDCHRKIHARPAEWIWLKQKYQRLVMAREGLSVEQFIERFGKSYLED